MSPPPPSISPWLQCRGSRAVSWGHPERASEGVATGRGRGCGRMRPITTHLPLSSAWQRAQPGSPSAPAPGGGEQLTRTQGGAQGPRGPPHPRGYKLPLQRPRILVLGTPVGPLEPSEGNQGHPGLFLGGTMDGPEDRTHLGTPGTPRSPSSQARFSRLTI